jgi:hypothetical protein
MIVRRYLLLALLVGMFAFTPLVSAQFSVGEGARQFVDGMVDIFEPIFDAVLNTGTGNSELLFAKILITLLLFIVIFTVLKRVELFGRVRGAAVLIALIISILAIRFISEDGLVSGILLQYGVLGVAITTFLPYAIYFWFVHSTVSGGFARKLAWTLYGIIFLLFWISRGAELSVTSNWINFFGLAAVALSIFLDGTAHRYFAGSGTRRMRRRHANRRVARLQAELETLSNVLHPTPEQEREIREIIHELRRLHGI